MHEASPLHPRVLICSYESVPLPRSRRMWKCSWHLINHRIHRLPAKRHSTGSELFLIIGENYRLTSFIIIHYILRTLITACIKSVLRCVAYLWPAFVVTVRKQDPRAIT